MSSTSLMLIDPPLLREDNSVEEAARALLSSRVRSLPVLDDDGHLVGMFGIHQLLEMMAPKAATIEDGLEDASFVNDSVPDLRRRLDNDLKIPVGKMMNREFTSLNQDTPLTQAVQLLHRGDDSLPVIDKEDGSLLGLVTYWGVLKAVTDPDSEKND